MKIWLRLLGVLVIVSVLAGLGWSRSQFLSESGCDFWELPRINQEISQTELANEELATETAAVIERIATKENIVEALANNECTLADAIQQFRELNHDNDLVRSLLQQKYPGLSEEECEYQNVLDYTRAHCSERSDYAEVQSHLDREWHALHPHGQPAQ
jgi:hypothetical protein